MKIWQLVVMEIFHRRLSFLLGLFSVAVAVATLVGAVELLQSHDRRTQRILLDRQKQTEEKMSLMEDDVRKAMLHLGFNIVILPEDQNLGDWHNDDYGAKLMPQDYVGRLAASEIVTIEHIVPRLRQRFKWPETKWTVIVVGTTDEAVYPADSNDRIFVESVPAGKVILGYEVHQGLEIKVGQKLALAGRQFTVYKCCSQRGTKDDMTIWLNLPDAQELLDKRGMINEILAVQCRSSWANLPRVQAEITKILPDTQVIEKASDTLAKVHAREKMAAEAQASIEREKQNFERISSRQRHFASVLVPLVMLVCMAWLAMLSLANVRLRRTEIGVLQAIGVRRGQVLELFLSRSIATGLCGGFAGYLAGTLIGSAAPTGVFVFDFNLLGLSLFVAVVITSIASGIPAIIAAGRDPAEVLSDS